MFKNFGILGFTCNFGIFLHLYYPLGYMLQPLPLYGTQSKEAPVWKRQYSLLLLGHEQISLEMTDVKF